MELETSLACAVLILLSMPWKWGTTWKVCTSGFYISLSSPPPQTANGNIFRCAKNNLLLSYKHAWDLNYLFYLYRIISPFRIEGGICYGHSVHEIRVILEFSSSTSEARFARIAHIMNKIVRLNNWCFGLKLTFPINNCVLIIQKYCSETKIATNIRSDNDL